MLFNSFIHIPGIGAKSEEQIWSVGIHAWDDFKEPYPPQLSARTINLIKRHLSSSRDITRQLLRYFSDSLSSSQLWRIFPHFRHATAYLDIETTGLDKETSDITTIALYDGSSIFHYVQGENLEKFAEDINQYEVLVTYNGKTFDVPMIERYFSISLDHAHIDLRYILRNLGFSGGLKGCEKQLGMDRGELDGVDGYFAVLLWREYERTGNRRPLETLLAYNIEDAVNLETLMVHAYNLNLEKTPFVKSHHIPLPDSVINPFKPDPQCLDELKSRYFCDRSQI